MAVTSTDHIPLDITVNSQTDSRVKVYNSNASGTFNYYELQTSGRGSGYLIKNIANDGNGLSNGGEVSLGGSVTLDVNVDGSSIEINSDSLRVKASGITKSMLENISNMRVLGNISGDSSSPSEITIHT